MDEQRAADEVLDEMDRAEVSGLALDYLKTVARADGNWWLTSPVLFRFDVLREMENGNLIERRKIMSHWHARITPKGRAALDGK